MVLEYSNFFANGKVASQNKSPQRTSQHSNLGTEWNSYSVATTTMPKIDNLRRISILGGCPTDMDYLRNPLDGTYEFCMQGFI